MRKVNDYWVDSNNNSWNCNYYTKEKAEELSKLLKNCRNCQDCQDCWDFKENPFRVYFQNIGSRDSQIIIYWNCYGNSLINCGCFSGTIYDFLKSVENTHGDNEYGVRYRGLIDSVFNLMEV